MSNKIDIPNYYLLLKNQIIEPILRKHGFKKNGVVWLKKLENKIIHIVEIGNRTVVVNDFNLTLSFGIYFEGVMELSYGFPFVIRHGVASCFWIGSVKKKAIDQFWNSKHYETFENLRDDVSNSLENKILPFLNTIQEYQDVKNLFSDENIQKRIKFDSIRALQLACFYYLIGEKNEGIQLFFTNNCLLLKVSWYFLCKRK